MQRMTVRLAESIDAALLSDLVRRVEHVVLQIPWRRIERPAEWTRSCEPIRYYLGEVSGRLTAVCGLLPSASYAQIRVFAVDASWETEGALRALLPDIYQDLREAGSTGLMFIGVEAWLVQALLNNGFVRSRTVVTLQKTDQSVPELGNLDAAVRPADSGDLPAIASIDREAFEPMWHNTLYALESYLADYPYFVVAELAGEVVGYAYAYLNGRHGHLTRLAVHPRYQGRKIGVRLLAETIAFFGRQRVYGITLNTQHDNVRARCLYEWFGFHALGREADVVVRAI